MARRTKQEKQIEQIVNWAFGKASEGHVIDAFDVGKVWDAGREAGNAFIAEHSGGYNLATLANAVRGAGEAKYRELQKS